MKRLIILFQIVFVAISYPLYGQQIPNASFETWSNRGQWGNLPRDWYGTNYTDFVNHVGVTRIADNAVDGQYHVKMEAKSINFFGDTYKVPGGLTLSDLYHATGVDFFKEGKPKAGVAFGGTPTRVTGYYKYKSVNNSEFYMSAVLTKWRGTYRDTIALGEMFSNLTVTEWTPFELKLDYNSTENPDTMNIVFLTSAVFNQNDLPNVQPGSTMEIDHLGLVMADYFEVDYTTEGNPCTGNTLTFMASSENIPASRWEWYIGPTYAGNQQTMSYQFPEVTVPTEFSVRLRGVSPLGIDEVTKIITIHPNPDIRLLPENPEICPGSTITLTATGGETYIWNATGAVNNQITVTPTLGTVYEIIGKDQYGCTNFATSRIFYQSVDTTNQQASFCSNSFYDFYGNSLTLPGIYYHNLKSVNTGCDSTIRLTLLAIPTDELSVISERNNICPGQTVILTATEGFESYDWGNGPTVNNTLEVNPEISTTYFVAANMTNGCIVTDSLTIEIIPPIVNVQQNDICSGDSILIFGDWQFTSGTYEKLFQNANGCDSLVITTVNVNSIPAVFNLTGSGTYGESEQGRIILLDGSESGDFYKLYKNGIEKLILEGTGSSLDFGINTEGSYWVIAENQNLCTSLMSDSVIINLLVNSNLPHETGKPYLYPIPAVNKVYISSPFKGSIRITDIQGRQVKILTEFVGTSIDIADLKPGVYFILLQDDLVDNLYKITITR